MTEEEQLRFFEDHDTEWIRILWCDNANIIRGKAFHRRAGLGRREQGVGISMAQQGVPVMADALVPESGLTPVGEVWLRPDWTSLRALPYAPGHASVMGDMWHNGQPWELCPREFLRRMSTRIKNLGLDIRATFENEFYLLRMTPDGFEPADQTLFASVLAMDRNREIIDEIARNLNDQGIDVEQYYPESGPGQHEISVDHAPALVAADRQIAYRETVHAVAARHGLRASFLPKLFADAAGNGCHLHFSLWEDGVNLVSNPERKGEMSDLARYFIAGILDHLPALMAFTTPSPNSFRRIRPISGVERSRSGAGITVRRQSGYLPTPKSPAPRT